MSTMDSTSEGSTSTRVSQRAPASCHHCYKRKIKCSKDPLPCDQCIARGIADRCHRECVKVVTSRQPKPPPPEAGQRVLTMDDLRKLNTGLQKRLAVSERELADKEALIQAQQRVMAQHGLSVASSSAQDGQEAVNEAVGGEDDLLSSEYAVLGLPGKSGDVVKDSTQEWRPQPGSNDLDFVGLSPLSEQSDYIIKFSLYVLSWIHCTTGAFFADQAELEKLGFQPDTVATLPRIWFDAAMEAIQRSDILAHPTLEALQAMCILPMLANTFGATAHMGSLMHLGLRIAMGFNFHVLGPEPEDVWSQDPIGRELGRRIWICLTTAERLGPSSRQRFALLYPPAKTLEPLNLNDVDIVPGQPRAPRPMSEFTDVSYLIAIGRVTAQARRRMLEKSAARTTEELCLCTEQADARLAAVADFCPALKFSENDFYSETLAATFDPTTSPPTFDYKPWARWQLAVIVAAERLHTHRWCVGKRTDELLIPRRKAGVEAARTLLRLLRMNTPGLFKKTMNGTTCFLAGAALALEFLHGGGDVAPPSTLRLEVLDAIEILSTIPPSPWNTVVPIAKSILTLMVSKPIDDPSTSLPTSLPPTSSSTFTLPPITSDIVVPESFLTAAESADTFWPQVDLSEFGWLGWEDSGVSGGTRSDGIEVGGGALVLIAALLLLIPTYSVLHSSLDTSKEHNALWASGSVGHSEAYEPRNRVEAVAVGVAAAGGGAGAAKGKEFPRGKGIPKNWGGPDDPEIEMHRKVAELILEGATIMPKLGNETIKAELGRASWRLLHTMAARFPLKPTTSEQEAFKSFLYLFARLYPCGECAEEFQALLKKHPPQVSSRGAASLHLCHLHNLVNERLGKDEFDCSSGLEGIYDCGCADEDPAHETVDDEDGKVDPLTGNKLIGG
ncbi:FAD dependent sulfhydryl oxidase Erv2 [Pseudohyphozyma bogoriensis]|nr:FAD dependent sulfhydryl oxidase Erv2 [Pseudohyphozyma bogoriensis]